jgi:hypothetical protein
MKHRYACQRLALSVGVLIASASLARADWNPTDLEGLSPLAAWGRGVCADLRVEAGVNAVRDRQAIDVTVLRDGAEGAMFRCPPVQPDKRLPPVPFIVDFD